MNADGEAPTTFALVVSFIVYVALGVAFKGLVLNWVVGPLWLLLTLYLLPLAFDRARQALGRPPRP